MTDSSYADPEQTYELDGRLMAPRQGASSTFEELIAARTTFLEIIRETYWNPWVREDRASEESTALAVMEQWEAVGPNPPTSRLETQEEFERRREEESAADSARQERDRERYDPARERARLSLLEQESLLRHRREKIARLRAGGFAEWSDERRAKEIADLQQLAATTEAKIATLAAIVGDREDVVDAEGRLPRDRRESALVYYRWHREQRVHKLRRQLAKLKSKAIDPMSASGRSKHWNELQAAEQELEELLAVPRLAADDMCTECATPAAHHGFSGLVGPCSGWPDSGARMKQVRDMFFARTAASSAPVKIPDAPKQGPIAVLPSELPTAELSTELGPQKKRAVPEQEGQHIIDALAARAAAQLKLEQSVADALKAGGSVRGVAALSGLSGTTVQKYGRAQGWSAS